MFEVSVRNKKEGEVSEWKKFERRRREGEKEENALWYSVARLKENGV